MSEGVDYYIVHTNYWPLFVSLSVGWTILFVGVAFSGRRFAFFALPLGIAIPLAQFAIHGSWGSLLDIETIAWNAAYWLFPGAILTGLALLFRRVIVKRAS